MSHSPKGAATGHHADVERCPDARGRLAYVRNRIHAVSRGSDDRSLFAALQVLRAHRVVTVAASDLALERGRPLDSDSPFHRPLRSHLPPWLDVHRGLPVGPQHSPWLPGDDALPFELAAADGSGLNGPPPLKHNTRPGHGDRMVGTHLLQLHAEVVADHEDGLAEVIAHELDPRCCIAQRLLGLCAETDAIKHNFRRLAGVFIDIRHFLHGDPADAVAAPRDREGKNLADEGWIDSRAVERALTLEAGALESVEDGRAVVFWIDVIGGGHDIASRAE